MARGRTGLRYVGIRFGRGYGPIIRRATGGLKPCKI